MDLLKQILAHEVYPALGCTEPVSCAYAAALAARELGVPVERLTLRVDPSTYKNGAAVTVPHSGGAKGNLVAVAIGAALARPEARLQLLQEVDEEVLARGQALCRANRCRVECVSNATEFYVEVQVSGGQHSACCVLTRSHTHIERIEKDGRPIRQAEATESKDITLAYRERLRRMRLTEALALADHLDPTDQEYLQQGVEMNLAISEWGFDLGGTACQLRRIQGDGFLADDLFYRVKVRVASAIDARMRQTGKLFWSGSAESGPVDATSNNVAERAS
jgi:L-cysteine desulfidase